MSQISQLTREEQARFPEFVEKWVAIGLSTEPADRPRSERAIARLYELAHLKPARVFWLPCPISGALSAVVYAALLKKVGGSAVDSAVDSAVRSAVRSAVDSAVDSAGLSYFGGSLWPAWSAWADFFNTVCLIDIDRAYLDLVESCGYYWTLDGVCFASERP